MVNTITDLLTQVVRKGECIEFTGTSTKDGYGRPSVNGRQYYMHRLAYEAAFGAIPDGLHVCHHCDNPPCINPKHLFLGTNRDNIADRVRKGRRAGPLKKAFCKHGHPLSGDNLGHVKSAKNRRTYCIACHHITYNKLKSK